MKNMGKSVCQVFFCPLGENWEGLEGGSETRRGHRGRSHQNKGKFCVLCNFVLARRASARTLSCWGFSGLDSGTEAHVNLSGFSERPGKKCTGKHFFFLQPDKSDVITSPDRKAECRLGSESQRQEHVRVSPCHENVMTNKVL